MVNNFDTATNTFKDLFFKDVIYSVPSFQRDYSWDNSNSEWDDIWEDINSEDKEHYTSFIVLKKVNNKN